VLNAGSHVITSRAQPITPSPATRCRGFFNSGIRSRQIKVAFPFWFFLEDFDASVRFLDIFYDDETRSFTERRFDGDTILGIRRDGVSDGRLNIRLPLVIRDEKFAPSENPS